MRIRKRRVLILVLVEDGLGADASPRSVRKRGSLNPCFSGGWSRSEMRREHQGVNSPVLILVLVEDGLGGRASNANLIRGISS